jgi:hypothetical protein
MSTNSGSGLWTVPGTWGSLGASVSVKVMLEVIEECFSDLLKGEGRGRLEELIPAYGRDLADASEAAAFMAEHGRACGELGLKG